MKDLRRYEPHPITNPWFEYCNKLEATHFYFGVSPHRIKPADEAVDNDRGYFIKCSQEDAEFFKTINWYKLGCGVKGDGLCWFSKEEVVEIYERFKNLQ